MSIIDFFKVFLKTPTNTGAVAPSSKKLAQLMVDSAKVKEANVIMEFGTGTGVFTEKILQTKSADSTFIAIEINPQFAEITRKRCPEVVLYEDDAANAKKYLMQHDFTHCDSIISGLPWANFGGDMQQRILDGILEALKPGGIFVTFAYISGDKLPKGKSFCDKLKENFSQVKKSSTVWANVPPAFAYICTK